MSIIEEIVQKRKQDIRNLSFNYGVDIPLERPRRVVPFLGSKGAILEIKRASPSKGDIAPNLDAADTARKYIEAGASAISVLTEQNYFKGSLQDLIAVCEEVGNRNVAVLRKDFLFDPEEVEIAYKCGADAVLLIARMLDTEKLIEMAKECAFLKITAFVELRQSEDLQKYKQLLEAVDNRYIVCGVNARDLGDFSIDFLKPAGMIREIRIISGVSSRVVFESGIKTPQAAAFAGSLGFTGMLLGEAAASNPEMASSLVAAFVDAEENDASKKWLEYAGTLRRRMEKKPKPFVKICGITSAPDAVKAVKLGADFLGFVFVAESKRNVSGSTVAKIAGELQNSSLRGKVRLVGVITDPFSSEAKEAYAFIDSGVLDFIQLHGCGDEFLRAEELDDGKKKVSPAEIPHYPAVNITSVEDLQQIDVMCAYGEPRILIDAKDGDQVGGTGIQVGEGFVEQVGKKTKLWLAGGIDPKNVKDIIQKFNPELLDVSSGVESAPGVKDYAKLEKLFKAIKSGAKKVKKEKKEK